jgi:hypothetical protein
MIYSTLIKAMRQAATGRSTIDRRERERVVPGTGLVLLADGVGGLDLCGFGMKKALADTNSPLELHVINWCHGHGRWLADLTDTANHRRFADSVAERAIAYRDRYPAAPIHLIGKSGGSAVIVKALESLPADFVQNSVLLAPALASKYDLSQALRAVESKMYVYWSPFDVLILGLGTRVFGTVDRRKSFAAGLTSFQIPDESLEPDRAAAYSKLRQVRWRPEMAATGYLGGHIGPDNPGFLKKYIVPLLSTSDRVEPLESGRSRSSE